MRFRFAEYMPWGAPVRGPPIRMIHKVRSCKSAWICHWICTCLWLSVAFCEDAGKTKKKGASGQARNRFFFVSVRYKAGSASSKYTRAWAKYGSARPHLSRTQYHLPWTSTLHICVCVCGCPVGGCACMAVCACAHEFLLVAYVRRAACVPLCGRAAV